MCAFHVDKEVTQVVQTEEKKLHEAIDKNHIPIKEMR